jgi:RNA polymerase sigma-70 factor (ECF subfamily)
MSRRSRKTANLERKNPHCYCSESYLLFKARRGDRAAFAALCERHSPRIRSTVLRIARNMEDAEDAFQDAVLSAFLHLPKFKQKSSFSTWFMRIAINSALMILRKSKFRNTVSLPEEAEAFAVNPLLEIADSTPNVQTLLLERQRDDQLIKAISQIRPVLREVVELRYFRELSVRETATVLGVSLPTTKARLFHARAQLRKKLKRNPAISGVR